MREHNQPLVESPGQPGVLNEAAFVADLLALNASLEAAAGGIGASEDGPRERPTRSAEREF